MSKPIPAHQALLPPLKALPPRCLRLSVAGTFTDPLPLVDPPSTTPWLSLAEGHTALAAEAAGLCRYQLSVWASQKKLVLAYREQGASSDGSSSTRGDGDGSLRPTQFAICPAADDYVVDLWQVLLLPFSRTALQLDTGLGVDFVRDGPAMMQRLCEAPAVCRVKPYEVPCFTVAAPTPPSRLITCERQITDPLGADVHSAGCSCQLADNDVHAPCPTGQWGWRSTAREPRHGLW